MKEDEDVKANCQEERKPSLGQRFDELTAKANEARRHLRRAQLQFQEARERAAFIEGVVIEREQALQRFIKATGGLRD